MARGNIPMEWVHGLGLFIPRLFDDGAELFARVAATHQFCELTESNKPGTAYRTGLYISDHVGSDPAAFYMMRCSTNFKGPTEMFAGVDHEIVSAVQAAAEQHFTGAAPLNHVLAQIYHNCISESNKERRAKIKQHSDKTKDMAANGLIAFCTFYDRDPEERALTRLRFTRKAAVPDDISNTMPARFDIALPQGSVFIIPLSTNRLYVHETMPAPFDINRMPTRMGYVIRSSARVAVHKDGQTFIDGVPLHDPTKADCKLLKGLYAEENCSSDVVEYPELHFSFNRGDYMPPDLRSRDSPAHD